MGLVDKRTLLEYLNHQPTHRFKALLVVDRKGGCRSLTAKQTGARPPIVSNPLNKATKMVLEAAPLTASAALLMRALDASDS